MAYGYESKLYANSVVHSITENVFIETGETKEIKEVYRKAKAWDNYIAEVRERVRFTENTEDDIESETQKVIDYYMEDE